MTSSITKALIADAWAGRSTIIISERHILKQAHDELSQASHKITRVVPNEITYSTGATIRFIDERNLNNARGREADTIVIARDTWEQNQDTLVPCLTTSTEPSVFYLAERVYL